MSPYNFKISFLLPLKNESVSVAKALHSLLRQSSLGEIVVIDGGADHIASKYIKNSYPDNPYIKIVEADPASNKWKKLRLGIRLVSSEFVMIASADEWLADDSLSFLSALLESTDTDCIQLNKTKRIKKLALKSQYEITGLINSKIQGEDYLNIIRMRGENRLITKDLTDKVYRTPLLRESLSMNFDAKWGSEEILNLHYFRHARSIVFTDFAGINLPWATPPESFEFKNLSDLRKVYEIKLIVDSDKEGIKKEFREDLYAYINMMISQLGWTREALIYYMSSDIKDPFWKDAGIEEPVESLISDALKSNNHNSFTNILKRLLR